MIKFNMAEAINEALRFELERDPNTLIIGEDVGYGVFRVTKDLQKTFGAHRVVDTPLAEGLIVGMGIGMATQGLRPIVEIQFSGFIYPATDQIVNHMARMRNRTKGRLTCPMVIRTPCFGKIHSPESHSESIENMFGGVPGIRIIHPSTPERAYRLLLAAVRSNDPVIFCEPTRLYRSNREEFDADGEPMSLSKAVIERQGNDITLVSWGAMCSETRKAAQQLTENGISVELIDLISTNPIDYETITNSIMKTGRCVIVQESPKNCSVSSEIAAHLADECILHLKAPVRRVTGWDITVPYGKMEHHYVPSIEQIVKVSTDVYKYDKM